MTRFLSGGLGALYARVACFFGHVDVKIKLGGVDFVCREDPVEKLPLVERRMTVAQYWYDSLFHKRLQRLN